MGASRRAAFLAGLGALACAFAGCEALIGLNEFSVRDCSDGTCDAAGAPDSGPDVYADVPDVPDADSTADVANDTTEHLDASDSDAPDQRSADDATDEGLPDVAPPTVTQIWTQSIMPNPNAPITPDSSILLPNPMSYAAQSVGGTVVDHETGLVWEASGRPALNYEEAATYCQQLQTSSLSWRVPTRIELASLIDWTHVPTLDVDAFAYDPDSGTGRAMGSYWTSSLAAPPPGGVVPAEASTWFWWHWTVSFATGAVVQQMSDGGADSVRCVSGGP